ncbi:MAG: Fic family protein, partial [Streptosporangiales bacterium]|nr:Fic family protein [Streptosporangiales bacterium]
MASDGVSWQQIVFAGDTDSAVLARAVERGTLRRLATGIYTADLTSSPEEVVRRHLWPIVGHAFPGAVLADRSAQAGGMPTDGALYVVHARRRPVALPGVTVYPRGGGGPQSGDIPLPDGLWLSSTERAMLDNLAAGPVSTPRRKLSRAELEAWIDRLLRQRGEDWLNLLRDNARALAPSLRRGTQMRQLDGLISAALTTRSDVELASPQLQARSAGLPYDTRRVEAFEELAETLLDTAPDIMPDLPAYAERRTLLPFYEAYFSNFIEGTEFTLDEAAGIVFDHSVPDGRPQDAHDVLGTYQIVVDPAEMATVPRSADGFIELLRSRHAILMSARPEKNPGVFKTRANRAGRTEFVAPELVTGTLRAGFETGKDLTDPFARAVYLMFLVAEVHPFDDGNGRISRIMMNAELASAGEVRAIVPIVYRANYLSALKGATHNRNFGSLIRTLSFARRYTARIDFSSRGTAEADLTRTHAFDDAHEAEDAGVRLTLP